MPLTSLRCPSSSATALQATRQLQSVHLRRSAASGGGTGRSRSPRNCAALPTTGGAGCWRDEPAPFQPAAAAENEHGGDIALLFLLEQNSYQRQRQLVFTSGATALPPSTG